MADVPFTEKSYWLTTRPYTPGPALDSDIEVDVAVIGAGYAGLTSAYFLKEAEPGLRVALLEADVVGSGASGRNGGFSMTKIGMMHSLTALRFGKQRTREAHQYAERAVNLVHEMVEKLGFDCVQIQLERFHQSFAPSVMSRSVPSSSGSTQSRQRRPKGMPSSAPNGGSFSMFSASRYGTSGCVWWAA